MINNDIMIHTKDLTKHYKVLDRREGLGGAFLDLFSVNYKIVKAVEKICMDIRRAEIVGFIGPNSAGKSTTIKMLTGVLKPTAGELLCLDFILFKSRKHYVKNIGVVIGRRTQIWWDLPVIESFKLLKAIYQIDTSVYEENLGLYKELVELDKLLLIPVRKLSLGQRMICDIAASFLHDPEIIFMDEPSIGLDIYVKSKVRQSYNYYLVYLKAGWILNSVGLAQNPKGSEELGDAQTITPENLVKKARINGVIVQRGNL